jgi:hypothetical protein
MSDGSVELRLVAALNTTDLLHSGLAGVAVDLTNQHAETVLLPDREGVPLDDIIEDFESDYWGSMDGVDAKPYMTCRLVDAAGWNDAVGGQAVPIFWSPDTAPKGAVLSIPDPWSYTRGGAVPNVTVLSEHERLLVHIIETRNVTLRVPLDAVSRVDVVIEGADTIISVGADVSTETRAIYERAVADLKGSLSQLPPGGAWKLRWNEAVPEPGPKSWPVLLTRHPVTEE